MPLWVCVSVHTCLRLVQTDLHCRGLWCRYSLVHYLISHLGKILLSPKLLLQFWKQEWEGVPTIYLALSLFVWCDLKVVGLAHKKLSCNSSCIFVTQCIFSCEKESSPIRYPYSLPHLIVFPVEQTTSEKENLASYTLADCICCFTLNPLYFAITFS